MAFKDIKGQKFGKLTATEYTGKKSSTGNSIWKFLCDCGNVVERPSGNIISRGSGSCGCFRSEYITAAKTTHGLSKTKEYKSWLKTRERTRNANDDAFPEYGGRGIDMSDDFYNSFEDFIAHVGYMPKDGNKYSLGRINNNIGYVEGNIRWETAEQQARNKRLQKNNSTGVSGVSWDFNGGIHYAVAKCYSLNGRPVKRCFSVKKYGLLPAFALACREREQMIEELNKQGAGYSASHGK